jgi:hypothetical protein
MRKRLILPALAALATSLALAPAASAAAVDPVFIAGNPSCAGGTKIEPVADKTFAVPGGTITIDVTDKEFAFTTNGVTVFQVIVKGGPSANLYDYAALGGVTSDSGLRAPLNAGKQAGLSHLCFFTDDKKPPPPPK